MRWIFSIDLILPATYGPGVDLASNRNDYQESSRGVKGCRRVRLTNLPPSVSRLSRENVAASTSHNPMGLHGLLQRALYFLIFFINKVFIRSNATRQINRFQCTKQKDGSARKYLNIFPLGE
jgi:hypothetical protein